MKTKLQLLTVALLLTGKLYGQTQLKQWFIGPKKIEISLSNPVVTPIIAQLGTNSSATANEVGNGIYDNAGNLLFYLADNSVYDYNNTLLGNLGYPNSCAEAVIVPFGTNTLCQQKFNIITTYLLQNKLYLIQTIVDLKGRSITSLPPDLSLAIPFKLEFGALAAGNANSNGDRFLYFLGGSGNADNSGVINKILIHPTGTLSFSNQILPFPGNGNFPPAPVNPPGIALFARELDLSPDGRWLGWAGYTPGFDRYHIVELDPITGDYQPGTYKSFNIPAAVLDATTAGFRGIEFYQQPGITRLFVGAGVNGIYYRDLIPSSGNWNQVTGSFGTNSTSYGFSQIEFAYNKLMYASSGITGTNVGAFSPLNPIITNPSPNSFGLNSPPPPSALYFFPGFPTSKLYTLPDQIDGQDYSTILPSPLPLVLTVNNYTCSNSTTWQYNATGNNPWNTNSTVHIIDKLEILPGVTLTIKDMLFKFSEQAKVIINPGATLIMDGTKFTSNYDVENCVQFPYTWKGVEVRGNPLLNQEAFHQGQLRMINNAIIEFAECGACVPSSNYSGAIIQSFNSQFKDNNTDVRLLLYQNFRINSNGSRTFIADKSRFTTVRFETTQYYPFTLAPIHVKLDNCMGLVFDQCSFVQSGNTPFLQTTQSVGILSSNSLLSVSNNCFFYQLWNGIRATRTAKNRSCFINNSTFENNLMGVYLGNINNAVLRLNTFNVGNGTSSINANHIGLWLNQCSGYVIQENSFNGTNINASTIGILTGNSGSADNQIYRNTFSNLTIGNLSNGINRDNNYPSISGLQYLCNNNQNNRLFDFSIQNKVNSSNGIKTNQGSTQIAAGNTLSQLPGTSHLNNKTNLPVNYFYFANTVETPVSTNNTINFVANYQNGCPSRIIPSINRLSPIQLQSLRDSFNVYQASFESVLFSYNQLLDGGNSNQLIAQIQQTWSTEVVQLYNQLMSLSPYVSETSLRELASSGLLPPVLLLNVLLNNPDGTKNIDFIKFLEYEISAPLPSYMVSLIEASWENKTFRTTIESALSDMNANRAIYSNMLLAEQFAHEVPDGDSLQQGDTLVQRSPIDTLLSCIHTLTAQIDLVEQCFNKEMYVQADSMLAAIPSELLLSEDQRQSLSAYHWFYNFRNTILQEGLRLDSLNELRKLELINFRNSNNYFANGLAYNVLCFYYGDCPEMPISVNENENGNRMNVWNKEVNNSTDLILAYPNPASKSVQLDYELSYIYDTGIISITDVTGKVLETYSVSESKGKLTLSLGEFQNGMYIVNLSNGNKVLARVKLLIQH